METAQAKQRRLTRAEETKQNYVTDFEAALTILDARLAAAIEEHKDDTSGFFFETNYFANISTCLTGVLHEEYKRGSSVTEWADRAARVLCI